MSQGFTSNNIPAISLANATTATGNISVAENTIYIQTTATYGFIPANVREFTSSGGSTGVTDRLFTAQSGTTVGGYAAIQSFRSLNFKVGQGAEAIFSSMWQNNAANSWSGSGLVNLSDELSFGYNGTTFGAWHRYGGIAEVRTITVTVGSSGSTNLTLTLNDVVYTIPLTSGTTAHNAYQIENWLNNNQSVWVADQIGNTVIISAQSDGAKGGSYSYSHATSTGTITQNKAGVTKTSVHIPQNTWNQSVASWLDPTKLNLFKIVYDGDVKFYIEDPETGNFTLVHVIRWMNNYTRTLLNNLSLRAGVYVVSLGSTTNLVVMTEYFSVGIQGKTYKTRNPRAVKNTQSIPNSAFTNILTVRNRRTYNSFYNQVEIEPVNLNVSSESSQNVEIEVRTNPTFSGGTNFASAGNLLVTDVDTTANTVSGGTLLAAFTLGSKGNQSINLQPFDIRVPPSLSISISAKCVSGASSNVTVALTYYEDI